MRFLFSALLAAFLLTAGTAGAFTYDDCQGNTGAELFTITGYNQTCITITNADSTGQTPLFQIRAKSAVACFDPNLATAGIATGQVALRKCINSTKPAANPHFECLKLDQTLTGVEGVGGTSCTTLDAGAWYVDVVVAVGVGITGRVVIQGTGD